MPIFSKPANAAHTALIYITIGALMGVWTLVWYIYLRNTDYVGPAYYWCVGFCLTGGILMLIGFGVGHIGRSAQRAELPPPEVVAAVAKADQATAPPAIVVPPQPALTTTMPVTPGVQVGTPVPPVEAPPKR